MLCGVKFFVPKSVSKKKFPEWKNNENVLDFEQKLYQKPIKSSKQLKIIKTLSVFGQEFSSE
jgi:hypothetical protein